MFSDKVFFMSKLIYCFLQVVAFLPLLGCRPGNESQKLAEVDGTTITQADLERSGGKALSKAREQGNHGREEQFRA
jgi:hypothetical protein